MTHSMTFLQMGHVRSQPLVEQPRHVPAPRHAQRPSSEQRHAAGASGEHGRRPSPANHGDLPARSASQDRYPTDGPPWAAPTTAHRVIPTASEEPPPPGMPPLLEPPVVAAVTPSTDPAATDLRSQVVRRLRVMNWKHTDHAWERRHRDPLGPHAVAFLYAEPSRGEPPRYELRIATRLFLAGDEVEYLPKLLYDLAQVIVRHQRDGGDVRALAGRVEDMSPQAFYLGVAVSSLDTPAGPWAQVRQQVSGSLHIPGRCYALLTDTTMLLLDRGGEQTFGRFDVTASARVDELRWTCDLHLADADPSTRDTWQQLAQLNRMIVEGLPRAR